MATIKRKQIAEGLELILDNQNGYSLSFIVPDSPCKALIHLKQAEGAIVNNAVNSWAEEFLSGEKPLN